MLIFCIVLLKPHKKHKPCQLFNAYGPTEATITSTLAEVTSAQDNEVSIGRAFGARQLYVLNAAHTLVPNGTIGELYIGELSLAAGMAMGPGVCYSADPIQAHTRSPDFHPPQARPCAHRHPPGTWP